MTEENKSEVVRIKRQFITAKLEQIGAHHEALKKLVGEQEAAKLLVETLEECE